MAKMTPAELDSYFAEKKRISQSFKDSWNFFLDKAEEQKPILGNLQSALSEKDSKISYNAETFFVDGNFKKLNSMGFLVLIGIGGIAYYVYKRGKLK